MLADRKDGSMAKAENSYLVARTLLHCVLACHVALLLESVELLDSFALNPTIPRGQLTCGDKNGSNPRVYSF